MLCRFYLSVFLFSLCNCFGSKDEIRDYHYLGMCEESRKDLAEVVFLEQSKESVQTRSGQAASIAATSGTAVTETLVYLGGGALVGALICSPLIALDVAADGRSLQIAFWK